MIDRDYRLEKAGWQHRQIKAYFLRRIGNEADWQAVSADPRRFNRVWRHMLTLPLSDDPPSKVYRQ